MDLDKLSGGQDLHWLPNPLPDGIKVLTSSLPGRSLDELAARGCRRHRVADIDADERRQLIGTRLGRFAKTLTDARLQRIASHPLGGSPLFLLTLANELRILGQH